MGEQLNRTLYCVAICITFIMILVGVVILSKEKMDEKQRVKEHYQEYVFYLNGQEVDFEKINIDSYDIEIKDNIVLLSTKTNSLSVVPLVLH